MKKFNEYYSYILGLIVACFSGFGVGKLAGISVNMFISSIPKPYNFIVHGLSLIFIVSVSYKVGGASYNIFALELEKLNNETLEKLNEQSIN